MCGRYTSTTDPATLAARFDAVDATGGDAPDPDHNVAPTKPVLAVVRRHPRDAGGRPEPGTVRSIRVMRWGLVPGWAGDRAAAARMINARAGTVRTKPAFRGPIRHHRCLVPADGWYEWKREGAVRRPYYLTPVDGSGLAMAGVWSVWRDPAVENAEPLLTCAVLTTDAVGAPAGVHDRMPLLCAPADWDRWLDPDHADIDDLLNRPVDGSLIDGLEIRPVSTAVNNVRHNGPHLITRADDGQAALDLG